MTRNDSTAPLALGLAALLGLLGERLVPAGPAGPGFALWILLLGSAAVRLARREEPESVGAVAGWSAVAVAAAAATALRDAPLVLPAMWLVLLTSASMVLLRTGGIRLWRTRPADHVLGLALVPGRASVGPLPLLAGLQPPQGPSLRRGAAMAKGAVLAVPLLLFFGGLFASADARFSRYVTEAATFWSEDLLARIALALAFGWVAAGLLSGVRSRRLPRPLSGVTPPRLGLEETAVVFGLLGLLFLTFVGFQLGYLFGGRVTIEATSGLTVADYARRGFFELMVVGLATVVLLLVGDALTSARRTFRRLAAVLVACVLVILASAVQRLVLYTDDFGLTVDRIVAAAIMAWVAVVLVLFSVTVLRERPRRFASGALVAGIVTAFALVLMSPERMAARSNLDRAAAGLRQADLGYLARLSADAWPAILERIDALPPRTRCELARLVQSRQVEAQGDNADWRTWNAARAEARGALRAAEARLAAAITAC